MVLLRLRFFAKPENFQNFGILKCQKDISGIIQDDFHLAFKIASDFDAEVQTILLRYLEFAYPIGLIKSTINDFKNSKEEEQLIIREWLFDQRKNVLFKLPFVPVMKEMLSILLIKSKVLPMEN